MNEFTISPYSITFAAAFVVSFAVVFLLLMKRGIPKNYIGYSMLLNIVLILYGAKTFSAITSGFQTSFRSAGFSSLGGAIGLLAGISVFGRIYREGKAALWESYITVLPLLYAIAKIGCYLVGCCHGISYHGPLCVSYDGPYAFGGPYFPVQLAESVLFFCIFFIALFLYLGTGRRYLVPTMMILCAVVKFSLDYLREEHVGRILSANQMVCMFFFLWGAIQIYSVKNQKFFTFLFRK